MGEQDNLNRREFTSLAAAAAAGPKVSASFDPYFSSAVKAAEFIRSHKMSSVELTEIAFRRIDQVNPKLNALVNLFREQAMEQARHADAALAKKESLGPLHGVPITVKECFNVTGVPTTAGVPDWSQNRPKSNAVAVDRLLNAGAVLLGRTNVPMFLGDWQSYNDVYKVTSNNPWDLSRTPGGSTGGGAAATAAGAGFLTLGSDIGGSIRVPSHFCGIYGHKPTLQIVPLAGHVPPPGEPQEDSFMDLAVAGPMARTPEDLRMALRLIAGPSGAASKALHWTLPAPRKTNLTDFRVGYVFDVPYCPLSDDSKPVFEELRDKLSKAGIKAEPGWPAGYDAESNLQSYLSLLYNWMAPPVPPEGRAALKAQFEKNPDDPILGAYFGLHADWLNMTWKRLAARALWQSYFQTHDVFLMPVCFVPAFPHDHSQPMERRTITTPSGKRPYLDAIRWPAVATLAGLPVTVAPIGRTKAGLPVGVQIMGPCYEDDTSIEFAIQLAKVAGGFEPPPAFRS